MVLCGLEQIQLETDEILCGLVEVTENSGGQLQCLRWSRIGECDW